MVVQGQGVLQILHELAKQARNNDMESAYSKFWQIWLQYTFPLGDNYLVTCEQPPDDSRRRVDIKVEKHTGAGVPFTLVALVEVKRAGASVKELEKQAVDAGKRALREYNYRGVYLLTTLGLGFRFWYMGQDHVLEPMEGESSPGSKRQKGRYRDVLDPEVNQQWWRDVELITDEPTAHPLQTAQSAGTTTQFSYWADAEPQAASSAAVYGQSTAQISYSTSTWADAEPQAASSTAVQGQSIAEYGQGAGEYAWAYPEQAPSSAYTTEAGLDQFQDMQESIEMVKAEPHEGSAMGEGSNQPSQPTTHQDAPESTSDSKEFFQCPNVTKHKDKKGKEYYTFKDPAGKDMTVPASHWTKSQSDRGWYYYETKDLRYWAHKNNMHKRK